MNNIEAIFQVDFKTLILYIFAIVFFVVTVAEVIGKFSVVIGKPVVWMRKRKEDHELIISIANEVKALKKRFEETEEQSMKRDQKLENNFNNLELKFGTISSKLDEMQRKSDEAEVSKLRDMLMKYYNKYKSADEWSLLDKEAFNSLLKQYESRGGDGYIHSVVVPVMEELKVVDK